MHAQHHVCSAIQIGQRTWDRMAGSSWPHSQLTVETSLRLSAFVNASS